MKVFVTVFQTLDLLELKEMLLNEINCSKGDCMLVKHGCLYSCRSVNRDIKKQARMGI